MKQIKIGNRILQIGLMIYIIENFYFGWNKTPMSELELYCDYAVEIVFYLGIVIYAAPILKLYEKAVKKNELK